MKRSITEAEHQRFLQDLEVLDGAKARISPMGSAFSGALMGVAIGYLTHRKDKGHRELLRHAGYGAAIGFGSAYVLKRMVSSVSGFGHGIEKTWAQELVGAPPLPVVTKGFFAGSPRALHPAYDPPDHRQHHYAGYAVGAPPPGGDYSFTRRPGYNGKDY